MVSYMDLSEEGRGRRGLAVAIGFFVLSLITLYMPAGVQSHVAGGLRATILRPFIITQENVVRARLRAEDARVLQAKLDSLAALLVSQGPLAEENGRLRELLGLQEQAPQRFVAASVVRSGTAGSESMFYLDVGSEDGVQVGDPVVMRNGRVGLVGVVQQVQESRSMGMDWSHPDFSVSAVSVDGNVSGIVEPRRGDFREMDRLLLNGVPYYEFLDPGTLIMTSGLGGVYPRGIPVGEVLEVAEEEGEWRRAYWLRPVVEPGSATHVLVLVGDSSAAGLEGVLEGVGQEGQGGRASGAALEAGSSSGRRSESGSGRERPWP